MCPRGISPPIEKYRDHSSPCNHTQHTAKAVKIDFVFARFWEGRQQGREPSTVIHNPKP